MNKYLLFFSLCIFCVDRYAYTPPPPGVYFKSRPFRPCKFDISGKAKNLACKTKKMAPDPKIVPKTFFDLGKFSSFFQMDNNGDYPGSHVKRLRVDDDVYIGGDTEIKGDLKVDGSATLSMDKIYTVDGTQTSPSYSWKDEKTLGFYRSAPGETSWTSGGTKRVRLSGTDAEYSVPIKAPYYTFPSNTTATVGYSTTTSTVDVSLGTVMMAQIGATKMRVGDSGVGNNSTQVLQIRSGQSGFDGPNSSFTFNAYFDSNTNQWRNCSPGRGGYIQHTSSGDYNVAFSTNSPTTSDQILTLINYMRITSTGAVTFVGTLGCPSVQCTSVQTQTMTSSIINCSNITATTMTCSTINSTSISATTTTTDTLNVNTLNYGTPCFWRGPLDDQKLSFPVGFLAWPISTTPYDSADISPDSPYVKIGVEGWYIVSAGGLTDVSPDGNFRYISIVGTSSGPLAQGYTSRYTASEPIYFSASALCYLQSGERLIVYVYSDTTNSVIFVGGQIFIKRLLL